MHLCGPSQLLRYVLIAVLLAPVIPAVSVPHASVSNAVYDNMIVHDAREAAPEGFVYVNDISGDKTITLELGLHGSNIPGMERRLYEVSTPGSPLYGKHLSKEEAESYARPTEETVREVNAWLAHFGVQSHTISPSGDRLRIMVPVSKANEMFHATFSTFRHAETGTESFQALSYSLPSQLKNMIESVEPTTSFPNPAVPAIVNTFPNNLNPDATCDQQVTPSCLQQLYGIPTTTVPQQRNKLAVPGFVNEYANFADLSTFLDNFRPDLKPQPNFTVEFINGGQNPQDPSKAGYEANLDIQYTVGLVNRDPVTFISSGLSNINGFINVVNYWLGQNPPPSVVSISYGFNENQVSSSSANNLCNLFMRLGTRGTSVLVASGDGGVAGSRPNNTCTTFVPTFPASCPYITAVGATQGTAEVGADLSAGGFSNYFTRPNYQSAAVNGYLAKLGSQYQGRFNPNGRAFPDVSAQGKSLVIVKGGQKALVDGTSASTPIFASVITLLNDRLLAKGRTTLGFLNPLLYARTDALKDIASGNNPSCGTSGFPAKNGWDPVTGLGTPIFSRMAVAIGAGETDF